MSNIMVDIQFWSLVLGESRQTVFCNPEHESRIKTRIDAMGIGGMVRVVASPYVAADRAFIANGWWG